MWSAHVLRAVELSADRRHYKSSLMWVINFIYELSSGYGNIPERALALIVTLVGYNALVIWLNELYAVSLNCGEIDPSAWLQTLCRGDAWSGMLASFLLALQPLVNPFGVFGAEHAVLPSSVLLATWLWLSNVGIFALLVLTGVGIRRRMSD